MCCIRHHRAAAALLLLSLLSGNCEAGPKKIFRRATADKKFLALNLASVALTVVTTFTIRKCMNDHGLGRCVGGDYGPFPAKEGIRNGMAAGFVPLDWWWKKQDEGAKHQTWWLLPVGNMAVDTGVIFRNVRRNYPPKELE